jgi:hypothetical protein
MADGRRRRALFIVSEDLSRVYGRLEDWFGDSGQSIWIIGDYPYAETYFGNGDVRLSELRTSNPIHLEPVCLYHFEKNLQRKE